MGIVYDYFLGIDVGTSGAKAALWDEKTSRFALECSEPYSIHINDSGWVTQDVQEILAGVFNIISKSVQKIKETPKPASVCIVLDTALHSIMFLDAHLEPLTEVIPWMDERAVDAAEEVLEKGLNKDIYETTGCPVDSTYPLYKAKWFAENAPQIVSDSLYVVSIKDYIFYKLTGQLVVDMAVASGTGYFDLSKKTWSGEIFEQVTGIKKDKLPQIVSPYHVTSISEPIKKQLNAENLKIDVMIGISDAAASSIGTVGNEEEAFVISIGTSAAVRKISSHPFVKLPHSNLWCYAVDEDHWIIGGALKNGGCVFDWYLNTFFDDSDYKIFEEHLAIFKKSGGYKRDGHPLFLPLLFGQRFPRWNPLRSASLTGLNNTTLRQNVTVSVMEGLAFNIKRIFQTLCDYLGMTPKEVVVTGGSSRMSNWMQLLAAVVGETLKTRNTRYDAAIGCVVFAKGQNWRETLDNMIKNGKSYIPKEKEKELYTNLYTKWLREMEAFEERRDEHVFGTLVHSQRKNSKLS